MAAVKKGIFWVILAAVVYALLSYHFILIGNTVKVLKKSELTLHYTFYNAKGKPNDAILSIDELRRDGIADLLVDMGRMSEEEKEAFLAGYEKEGY